jgi:hypothetical protein
MENEKIYGIDYGDVRFEIRAGLRGEGGHPTFSYNISTLPTWLRTVDQSFYRDLSIDIHKLTEKIVLYTGKSLNLNLEILIDESSNQLISHDSLQK